VPKKLLLLLLLLIVSSAGALQAEKLIDFAARLPSSDNAGFKAAKVRDLSVHNTSSKGQWPTGMCPSFSFIAGVEAAYTRKYCSNPNSSFYKAGYCDRYVAYKAANPPAFHMAKLENFHAFEQYKALNLSELYYVDRVKTSMTTSASANHETSTIVCGEEGVTRALRGPASLMLSDIRLPEEQYAVFVQDPAFYPSAQLALFGDEHCDACTKSPTQAQLDNYEFSEKKFDFLSVDEKPVHRAFIPVDARRNARFGVADMVFADDSALANKIDFYEKCIYSGFEVIVEGAIPGHSMLLIGYDRDRKKLLYKDHYERFKEVDYDVTAGLSSGFQIIIEPASDWTSPSTEEMWLGAWDTWVDGQYGKLVIRRSRLAGNVKYTSDDLFNKEIPELSTTAWARVGTFYEDNSSVRRIVYGRLNGSGGDRMQLIVDFDHPEPPPPSVEISGTPAGQLFEMRVFDSGPGAGMYATGTTTKGGVAYGVLMKRPGEDPLGLIPLSPDNAFFTDKWEGTFLLHTDGGGEGVLTLNSQDDFKTVKGTYKAIGGTTASQVTGTVENHHLTLTVNAAAVYGLNLYFHTADKRLVTGRKTIVGLSNAVFGYRTSGETHYQTRLFFPYFDIGANSFNGFAVSNYSDSLGILKFTAYTKAGVEATAPQNPAVRMLSSGHQTALLADEIFGANPSKDTTVWVELTSDSSQVGAFSQYGDGVQLDGAVPWSAPAKNLYFSRIYQGQGAFRGKTADTILTLANPNSTITQVQCEMINVDGKTMGLSQPYTIGPFKVLQRSVSQFFGENPGVIAGAYLRVRVTLGEGIVGAAVIRLTQANTTFCLNALVPESDSNVLYSAQIAKVDSYFTFLRLINTSDETRNVTIRGINDSGTSLGIPKTLELLPGGLYHGYVDVTLSTSTSATYVGSLKVEADGPGVVGDVVFGDPLNCKYVAALALQDKPFKKAVFNHVANGGGFFTGIAVYNPGSGPASVTISVYSKTGALVGKKNQILAAGQRMSQLVAELVPASASQLGGYVLVEATEGVVAQELFASDSLAFLSSVPPTVIE